MNQKTEEKLVSINYADLVSLITSANGFYKAFEYAFKELVDKDGNVKLNDTSVSLLPVIVVNGVLAIELYLKWICAFGNWQLAESKQKEPEERTEFPKTHDLNAIYNAIPELLKKDFCYYLNLKGLTEADFIEFIIENRLAFVEWRYSFAFDKELSINTDVISKILLALQLYCKKLLNDYNPPEEWVQKNCGISIVL